jgi:hypothetical protein
MTLFLPIVISRNVAGSFASTAFPGAGSKDIPMTTMSIAVRNRFQAITPA